MHRIYPILLFSLFVLASYAQEIEIDAIGMSGVEVSNTDIIINSTTGELVSTTVSNGSITLTQGFQQTSQLIYIKPKAFLQGALLGTSDGLMRDDLRSGGYIPNQSPYNENVRVSDDVLTTTGNDAIVDWINVEIRNSNYRVVGYKSALLQRDGDIVCADGVSPVQLSSHNKDYYVKLTHRNHLGTMTQNQITMGNIPTDLDFSDGSFLTYGNFAQAEINATTNALWAGNVNGDTRVRYQGSRNDTNYIKGNILSHPNNTNNSSLFYYFAYDNADINMDGRIRYQGSRNDTNYLKGIILSHPNNSSLSSLFYFLQQTPN